MLLALHDCFKIMLKIIYLWLIEHDISFHLEKHPCSDKKLQWNNLLKFTMLASRLMTLIMFRWKKKQLKYAEWAAVLFLKKEQKLYSFFSDHAKRYTCTICKGQVASRKSQVCSAATFASFILTLSFTEWTTGRGYERVQWKLKTTMISWLCYNESTNYEILNTFVKKGKYINIIFMRYYIWSFHRKNLIIW